ncbi:hypothetical protein COLO4_27259 [Corchorus olitorius]|uniref:Uncharacterized protein n=1 Tax=Corchorus olitorius TaxID=93759 RepID=A0A1R3HRT8_9ROSI|nr:hypothetical protein COLO4_27259 [Corchorus olitorius]
MNMASIEALAMSGVDYNEWGLDIEKWEADDDSEWPPPHLQLEEEEDHQEPQRVSKHGFHRWEDFENYGDNASINGGIVEFRHRTESQGRLPIERIIYRLRAIKLMVRCIVRLLMITIILERKKFLKRT